MNEDVLLKVGGDLVGSEEVSVEGKTTALPFLVRAVGDFEVLHALADLLEFGGVNLDDANAKG